MNTKLIEKYLAKKIAIDCTAGGNRGFEAAVVGAKFYCYMQMNEPISSFNQEFLSLYEDKLQKRFGIRPHPHLFVNPTLGQWIVDVTATWTKDDIFNIISERAMTEIDFFDSVSSDSDMLDIIELLEAATGKSVCQMAVFDDPMNSLSDLTYKDMVEFFAS